MAIDGKLFAKAKRKLEAAHREREALLERRTEEVYAQIPRVKELDSQIQSLFAQLIESTLSTGSFNETADERLGKIRSQYSTLQSERLAELKKAGFPDGYLDDEYVCALCKDTGYIDAKMCDCLKKLYKAEQTASLSNLLKMGEETFDSFDLSYYSDTPVPETGISPRQSMEIVFQACVQYAGKFGANSTNLFLNGAPGLGKTFLSACIARVVSDKDYSVVYDMAISVFSKYEDVQFSKVKGEDFFDTREEIRRYLECDLLIIDDLGTEMTTSATNEALYEIINTRLITNRKTIVNSNLTVSEMHSRYSEQIMSRLEGEYQMLTFYGEDIRKKRKLT